MKVRRNREEQHVGRLLPGGCQSSVEMETRVVVRSSAPNQKELRVDLSVEALRQTVGIGQVHECCRPMFEAARVRMTFENVRL